MKWFLGLSLLVCGVSGWAAERICNLANKVNTSELKVEYDDSVPTRLFLRSPGEEVYRQQDVNVKVISLSNETENFNVTPHFPYEINWKTEENCFKRIGTQWHFILNDESGEHFVSFAPYYLKESVACLTPRLSPQLHKLSCELKSTGF